MLKLGPDRLVLIHQSQIGQSTTELLALTPTWQHALHAITYNYIYLYFIYILYVNIHILQILILQVDHRASCPDANLTTCSTCNNLHIIQTPTNTYSFFKSTKEVSALTPTVPSLKTCSTCKNFHQTLQLSFFVLDITGQERQIC